MPSIREILNNEVRYEVVNRLVGMAQYSSDSQLVCLNMLIDHIQELEAAIEAAKNCLVCCSIADGVEICETTYEILDNEPNFSIEPPALQYGA